MDEPVIATTALRHGLRPHDILHAIRNPVRAIAVDDGITMLIGPGRTGALLEIGVVQGHPRPVVVHAMPARVRFLTSGGER